MAISRLGSEDYVVDLNIITENYWTERERQRERETAPVFERISLSTEKPNKPH